MDDPSRQQPQQKKQRFRRLLRPYLPAYFPVAWKMGLSISAMILLGMAVLGTLLLNNQLERMRQQADSFGGAIASQLAHTAREPLLAEDRFLLKVHINNLVRSDNIYGATLFDRDGGLIDEAGVQPARRGPLSEAGVSRWTMAGSPMSTYISPVMVNDIQVGAVAITLSDQPIALAQKEVRTAMITATVIMGLIAIIASFVISRRLSQPIRDLLAATSAMRRGDLQFRIRERRNDEIGLLIEAYNSMAHSMLEKDQVERVLQRFVSPSVAKSMMADLDQVTLGGRDVNATVVFADIVGFTRLSESLAPEAVAHMLNVYFDAVAWAADSYRGTIDKYMGDCAMIVFGVPEEDPEHLFHGLCCAVMIQRLIQRLNEHRQARGLTTVEFRIGINSGAMLAGNLGSRDRMQYTVVGDTVNLASRLSNMAAAGEIIAAAAVFKDANIAPRVRALEYGSMRVRGRQEPVSTYRVDGVHALSETLMEQRIAQFLTRLNTDGHRASS
ncbi:adenylate/guanylate cyclase domain-containing protein [Alloalcanivorax xenomutans]|uniref:adenylate/guanylate cyclase domain-containing protein n=1 Tax=Alloalcanivorax xenomutans TaxID=1094342 RepID=UPI0017E61D63|nr:adenylate/guanylate cyclase domain-containing protein [Alloalcanivorax xenomutans]MBA4722440.1 HAMP domain-containing protein [Alcanivorax sp.]WOA30778.1 adenylate/guanylate cyclase domain-containing protein [Alloalcanivorax xenomutans]